MTVSETKPSSRMKVAENVRVLRMAMGVSQEALALKAGFHRTYVSQVEREMVNLTVDNLDKLARALKVDSARLLAIPRKKKEKASP
ncbi:helix-turn-helix domain-containing protein [Noviherbaspirillum sp. Root189]|uniref:helix-turn-helix domain-containing protein n=1 Tax=Noviherbaspirillum sp. Root189 TaxID=1736487 RepID=UPI00070EF7DC|nr:helix-turn-helix transcriptional regulator [Noviherbaspirillum sp. Root189]KRB79077.1 hypothetical protein ASE07_05160 [Noviherbaspirillum sp. Root189]